MEEISYNKVAMCPSYKKTRLNEQRFRMLDSDTRMMGRFLDVVWCDFSVEGSYRFDMNFISLFPLTATRNFIP